jgi:DNA-binding response OmpR family regulator
VPHVAPRNKNAHNHAHRKIRRRRNVARSQSGADDYLTKPFRPRELVARIQAVLRRSSLDEEHVPELCFGDLSVNLSAHEVRLHGKSVALTPTEFKLLETLMREPGRVFRREELVRHVFGDDYDGVDRTIDVHMMNVRKKIEPQPNAPVYVQTVFGIGYKFSKECGYESI